MGALFPFDLLDGFPREYVVIKDLWQFDERLGRRIAKTGKEGLLTQLGTCIFAIGRRMPAENAIFDDPGRERY